MFYPQLLSKITMGKGIGLIYKYDQRNCSYPYLNTKYFIPPRYDTSIKTKRNSASDASVGEHDIA